MQLYLVHGQRTPGEEMHGRKSTPTLKFLGTAEAYFVGHISPNFQISLIYAFLGCRYSMIWYMNGLHNRQREKEASFEGQEGKREKKKSGQKKQRNGGNEHQQTSR